MKHTAFIYGFRDEAYKIAESRIMDHLEKTGSAPTDEDLEKMGIAFLAPLAAMAGRALATQGVRSLVGRVATNLGPKVLKAAKGTVGKAMSTGTKGGAPGLAGKLSQGLNIASNLGGFADIIRAKQQKQPANAGNTITTPGH